VGGWGCRLQIPPLSCTKFALQGGCRGGDYPWKWGWGRGAVGAGLRDYRASH
jgi:hypothetical protein